jgi:glutaminyl-peptide cyclotransferase
MSRSRVSYVLLASGACLAAGVLVALASGWLTMPTAGARNFDPSEAEEQERTPFAGDRAAPEVPAVAFDGKRALDYLKRVCDIGPRISGSAGMQRQQELLRKHFEGLGATVQTQPFTAKQKSQRTAVDMANLIVSWHPERKRRVILCSHYDTRPIADQERDPRKWREKFISANDGGSGVALLMELGNHMKDLKTAVGVDFVFFDGEEYIFNPERNGDEYFFGSKYFAQNYRRKRPDFKYTAAVLFDMIAGQKPRFPVEANSLFLAPELTQQLWTVAQEQQCSAFRFERGPEVMDDHLALNRAGIPAVDIIDFDYPYWHRLSDVPDNCAAEGLVQVARVLGVWLQRTK